MNIKVQKLFKGLNGGEGRERSRYSFCERWRSSPHQRSPLPHHRPPMVLAGDLSLIIHGGAASLGFLPRPGGRHTGALMLQLNGALFFIPQLPRVLSGGCFLVGPFLPHGGIDWIGIAKLHWWYLFWLSCVQTQ